MLARSPCIEIDLHHESQSALIEERIGEVCFILRRRSGFLGESLSKVETCAERSEAHF